jgi:hypothetical protein
MRVTDLSALEAAPGRIRLQAVVRYGDGEEESPWIEVPALEGVPVPPAANHWAAALLPCAAARGEPLDIEGDVDPWLLEGAQELQKVWTTWGRTSRVSSVVANPVPAAPPPEPRVGLFFSGGVDSFHSLLRNHDEFPPGDRQRIGDLLLVHGADIDVENADAFRHLDASLGTVAAQFGARLLVVATNLRRTRWGRTDWPRLAHGAFLAGMAHATGQLRLVRIASSGTFGNMGKWGSSPLTDPLFSSSAMRLFYDSGDVSRFQKIALVARSPEALAALRVCWRSGTERNCGRCYKCLRTMIILELHGALAGAPSFAPGVLDLDAVARLQPQTDTEWRVLRGLSAEAMSRGRKDIMRAIDRAVRVAERVDLALAVADVGGRHGLGTARRDRLKAALLRRRIVN